MPMTKIHSADDFTDLDDLLKESTAIHTAVKARNQGRKLTDDQKELLAEVRLAVDKTVWVPKQAFAYIVETTCECGNHYSDFHGWFQYQEQPKGKARRLVRTQSDSGLPASRFTRQEKVRFCPKCVLHELPEATFGDCDLLAELVIGQVITIDEGEGNPLARLEGDREDVEDVLAFLEEEFEGADADVGELKEVAERSRG